MTNAPLRVGVALGGDEPYECRGHTSIRELNTTKAPDNCSWPPILQFVTVITHVSTTDSFVSEMDSDGYRPVFSTQSESSVPAGVSGGVRALTDDALLHVIALRSPRRLR